MRRNSHLLVLTQGDAQTIILMALADRGEGDQLEFDPGGLSPEAHKKGEKEHHAHLLKKAKAAVALQRNASLIRADVHRQRSVPEEEGLPPHAAGRAVTEYLKVLDYAAFGGATPVEPRRGST